MPRKARQKSPESIYHIMCRSISELLLFRDTSDKDYYLDLIKRYLEQYKCCLYAYCLMDNHLHLQLDPKGFDVSKFMHSLNTAYVRYYNKKYCRHGHVFQERFESRILGSEAYNVKVSAYIHNNPHDIANYLGKEEEYPYSSYGIYLGLRKDLRKLIDKSFIMSLFNVADKKMFPKRYCEYVSHLRDAGSLSELKEKLQGSVEYEYVSGRTIILREKSPSKVISFISEKALVKESTSLAVKSKHSLSKYRSFTAYVLRVLCGLGYKDICMLMNNITISACARMCNRGYRLLSEDSQYSSLFDRIAVCEF